VLTRSELGLSKRPGPLIIEQYDTTVVVPPDSGAFLDASGNLIIEIDEATEQLSDDRFDPVTRELVRHSLEALADEMALTVVRTSRSNHVKHTGDFSTAIADGSGQLIAQGLTVPLHLGALPDAFEAILAKMGGNIHEGDVMVMNDPFGGGMHLPDIFIIKPVFHDGKLVAMTASITHQVDIGGRVAGGNSTLNTEVYAEGLRLPLMKLYDRGVLNESIMEIIRANVRLSERVEGDIHGQLSAVKRGEHDYKALVARFGIENLRRYQNQLIASSELVARETIRAIPDGVYTFEDFMDGDSYDPDPIPIRVAIQIKGDEGHRRLCGKRIASPRRD